MAKSKTSTKADEPKNAKTPEPEAQKAPAKAVKAVFVPVGHVNVHLETPSGNEYNLVPRKVFTIKAEDVEWFFTEWHWSFRQRLVRKEDYKPTCGYYDPKAGGQDYSPQLVYDPKPMAEAKPIDAPVVDAPETEIEADSGEKE